MGKIDAINISKTTEANSIARVDDHILNNAELIQKKVNPHIPHESYQAAENHLKAVSPELQEVYETVDQHLESKGHKSLHRRLLELNQLISEVVEKYIWSKKDKQFEKKCKIEGNVKQRQSLKNYQATTFGISGIGGAICGILSGLMGGNGGKILETIGSFAQPSANMLNTVFDGKSLPLDHKQQLYVNSVQQENQSTEGLKKLIEQLSNNTQQVSKEEAQAFEKIGQRG